MSKTDKAIDDKATEAGAIFVVHNIYVKDVSYEAPQVPHIFSAEWQPKVDFDLQMGSQTLGDDLYEVVLHVTVNVKVAEEKTAFVIDVQQAGIFLAQGMNEVQLKQVLSITGPNVLFPYVRETVSNLVTRGGFPQFVLPPVNFEALYLRHMEELAAKEKNPESTPESVV